MRRRRRCLIKTAPTSLPICRAIGATGKEVVGTPPPATQTCVACHGADGAKAIAPDYPMLAGQSADYIVHALQDYKSGKRKNPVMAGIISGVDEEDFEALGEFFSQPAGVVHHRSGRKARQVRPRAT